jgi:8-oxo-dGTP pyrophosphatase MutT (NUDIX family)
MALPPAYVAIDVDLDAVRARLSGRQPKLFQGQAQRRAAVAAILRRGPLETELLLIRRAERAGDPWSGHIALPGGHESPGDPNLLATARRETREEVGLDLAEHELLGALDEHAASAQGRFIGLVIAPFVFALRRDAELRPNYEVADLLWAPLGRMARGEIDVVKELERDGRLVSFPGFGVGEHVVWGLTHRVLQSLFGAVQG